MSKRKLTGTVVSNKMEKTAIVRVERVKESSKYKKRFRVHKRYKVHAEQKYEIGDKVIIQESRPMSKDKRFIIIKKI